MKKIGKVISLVLALLIVMGAIGVNAATNEGSYVLKNGVLVVSGVEEVPSFKCYQDDSIKTLYVCRGVKSVERYAFCECSNLSRVELSDTVTEIGYRAFDDAKITRIGIPKSVTDFDGYSFDYSALSSYSDSVNKKMVVYCEKGSAAEEFAKEKELKYVTATIIYGTDGRTMMVDANERKTQLATGNWFAEPNPVKMYAIDGRTKYVEKSKVAANKKVGWYTSKPVLMYAADGRTKYVGTNEVEANKKVGWYNGKPVKMYAADGRTKTVGANEVEANKKVGWYTEPVVKMYAVDGRTKYVEKSKVEANKKVGWYTEPVVKMYSAAGKTKYVEKSKVEANKKVGWYLEPVIKMYSIDGKTKYVEKSKVEANKKVGWYDGKPTKMYAADGRTKTVGANEVEANKKAGWYLEPVVKMYAADGKTKYVEKSKVEANKKVGWYTEPVVKMYALSGKTKYVEKSKVDANKKVGWYLYADYIVAKSDQDVKLYGYNYAITILEETYYNTDISDTATRGKIDNKITSLLTAWRKAINAPIAVVDWYRTTNSIGTPEINIIFRNVSTKTIVSLETEFTCYDAYGNATADYSWYDGTYTGYADNVCIVPGEEVEYCWTLYSNERTRSISWPKLTKVAFVDGTSWKK